MFPAKNEGPPNSEDSLSFQAIKPDLGENEDDYSKGVDAYYRISVQPPNFPLKLS